MNISHVIALEIMHRASHAGITLAKAKVIRRVVLRRLTARPIPLAAVLDIDHVNRMPGNDGLALLQTQIVYAA